MIPNKASPPPFSFSPDQTWNGNAGSWSTFIVRVGTPPQDFHILPSTNNHELWIPVPAGCTSTDPPNCGSLRGALPFHGTSSNGFLSDQSSSWEENGLFTLAIESAPNVSGNGDYGYDTVGLEVENSGGLTLEHQVVAGIATQDFYLGQLGLGPKPSNFTTLAQPVPSFLKNLVTSGLLPSFSYSYTAGARYRLSQVLGSLTFGGYDASRFIPSNIGIPFASDDSRSLTVGVQLISASNTLQGSVQPLSSGAYFLIDSSVSDLWLPEKACQSFEKAFGLTYDNTTGLYLVNDTVHSQLVQLNPSITLKIGIQDFDGPTANIVLPYGALDLQASSPFYPNATNYYPIRRAANSTQYTLGRAFLQEAYIIVDYERSNFSVNQAIFTRTNSQNIIAIPSVNSTSETNSTDPVTSTGTRHPRHHINPGTIAGITIAILSFLALITTALLILRRRNRHKSSSRSSSKSSSSSAEVSHRPAQAIDPQMVNPAIWIPELGQAGQATEPLELSASHSRFELGSSSVAKG